MKKFLKLLKQLVQGKTLASQILFNFFIAALIASIVIGSLLYISARQRIKDQLAERFNDDANLMTTYIEQTISTAYFDIQLLSYNSIIESPDNTISDKLRELEKTQWLHGLFSNITLMDDQGQPVAYTANSDLIDLKAEQEIFREVIRGTFSIYISDVQNMDDPENMTIYLGAPVFDQGLTGDWNVLYVITAQLDMEQIWRFTDNMKIGETGYVALIDRSNRYIAHPDKNMLSRNMSTESVSVNENKLFDYRETAGGDKRAGLLGQTISNPSWIDKGWRVVVSQDSSEAYSYLRHMLWLILIILLTALVFFLIAGLLVSRRLTKPIQALSEGTKRIALGEFSHRMAIKRKDEIGDLAQAYNEMALKLEERESDSKRLQVLRKGVERWTSVSTLSVGKYVSNLAEAILDIYGCFAVWILVTKGQKLESRAFSSLRPEAQRSIENMLGQDINHVSFDVQIDDNLVTRAFNSRQSIFMNAPSPSERGIVNSLLSGKHGGVAAVPLCTETKCNGVMVIVQDMFFSLGQKENMLALALHSSVALDNALLYESAQRQSQEKSRLYELAVMSSSLEFRKVLDVALDGIMSLLPSPEQAWVVISSYDEQTGIFTYEAGRGQSDYYYGISEFKLQEASKLWLSTLSKGKSMIFPDITRMPDGQSIPNYLVKILNESGMKSWIVIPLMVRGRLIGALRICNRLPIMPSEEQQDALRNLANNISIAMDNARLYETAQKQNQEKSRLYNLAGLMSSSLDFREVLDRALEGVMSLVPSPETAWAILTSMDESAKTLTYEAGRGNIDIPIKQLKIHYDEPSAQWLAPLVEGKVIMHKDITLLPEEQRFPFHLSDTMEKAGMKSWVVMPLIVKGHLVGTLRIANKLPVLPNDVQMDALRNLANNIGIAMENASLYAKERKRATELQTLERLKTDFMLAISHELKTPLTSLNVAAGLLQEEVKTEPGSPVSRLLVGMSNSVTRLNRLVSDLLEAARLQSSTIKLNWEFIDIVPTVKTAAGTFTTLLELKNQQFIMDVPPNGLWAYVDSQRLEQVVANLLSNAHKFTPSGGQIRLILKEDGDYLVLEVSDTGPGIPADEQSRIFEPFYRARGAPRHTGTGLGLTIVSRVVELHGGTITVRSQPNQGTTFTITIPKGIEKQPKEDPADSIV